jgi:hypothetical protein
VVFELEHNTGLTEKPNELTKKRIYGKFGQELKAHFRLSAQTQQRVEVNSNII